MGETGIGKGELGKAPQKLEAMFKAFGPELLPDGIPKSSGIGGSKGGSGSGGYVLKKAASSLLRSWSLEPIEIEPDGDCFYNAVLRTLKLTGDVQTLRSKVADRLLKQKGRYAKFLNDTESIDTVAERIRTPGAYAGADGDLTVALLGDELQLSITILSADGKITNSQSHGTPILLIRFSSPTDHFHGTRKA